MTDVVDELPVADLAVPRRAAGIDFIPIAERWATPRAIAGLWAGASVNVEYLVYGAILMTFGFSFDEALVFIVVGNLSWVLVGFASLQGPQAGTTVFGINRAPFGPTGLQGDRAVQLADHDRLRGRGPHPHRGRGPRARGQGRRSTPTPLKVALILVAVAVQVVLPFLGHATMARVLRWLIVPFVRIYVVLAGFAVGHAHVGGLAARRHWQLVDRGARLHDRAVRARLDRERQRLLALPAARPSSRRSIVGWLFVAPPSPRSPS